MLCLNVIVPLSLSYNYIMSGLLVCIKLAVIPNSNNMRYADRGVVLLLKHWHQTVGLKLALRSWQSDNLLSASGMNQHMGKTINLFEVHVSVSSKEGDSLCHLTKGSLFVRKVGEQQLSPQCVSSIILAHRYKNRLHLVLISLHPPRAGMQTSLSVLTLF